MTDADVIVKDFFSRPSEAEQVDEAAVEAAVQTLRHVMDLPLEHPLRLKMEKVCSLVRRSSRKARSKDRKQRARDRDAVIVGETGIREAGEDTQARRESAMPAREQDRTLGEVEIARACYICKIPYTTMHFFYDRMCERCAPRQWEKRFQRADLTGRRFLLTGGRMKIGFELGLKLLRDGAQVRVTTRFPYDAARRYAEMEDFEEWSKRLHIHGLDLRHLPAVEAFCVQLSEEWEWMDGIIHNAAQTVARPAAYYADVLAHEQQLGEALSEAARALVRPTQAALAALVPARRGAMVQHAHELLFADEVVRDEALFPRDQRDEDGLQLDLREQNSWMLKLHEIEPMEMVEVQLVNAIAPFTLDVRLKPLMLRSPHADRYVVHVAAKEGQFEVSYKSYRHPHTNMAKAALNMLTRTSAEDWAREGIYMTSADTGWVTYEQPDRLKRDWLDANNGPPLDVVDGAARVYDPIVRGVRDGEHLWGKLFVNYDEAPW